MSELISTPPDLTTSYLGLRLKNPLVASASPLSKKVDRVKRLEEAGASAVVMYSLFEEQIVHESRELDYYLRAPRWRTPICRCSRASARR